jgi:hypothetical protein
MSPLLPTKYISARDLWPLKEGRQILEEIEDKDTKLIKINQGSWLVSIEKQWQMRSLRRDFSYNGNQIRQQFTEIVQTQQKLTDYLSLKRCFAITENQEGEWRLWQIVKRDETLNHLIEKSYANQDTKKISAVLFIVINKFFAAYQRFSTLDIQLPLSLDNLSLDKNTILFTGFIPTDNEYIIPDIEKCVQLAFQKTIKKLILTPSIKTSLVAYYLSIHAHKNGTDKMLINALLKLFK